MPTLREEEDAANEIERLEDFARKVLMIAAKAGCKLCHQYKALKDPFGIWFHAVGYEPNIDESCESGHIHEILALEGDAFREAALVVAREALEFYARVPPAYNSTAREALDKMGLIGPPRVSGVEDRVRAEELPEGT